jgi:hypothetical protein
MPVRLLRHAAAAVLILLVGRATVIGTIAFGKDDTPAVRLDMADSTTAAVTGLLESITADTLLLGGGDRLRVPVADVRRLEIVTEAEEEEVAPAAVVLRLADGGRLTGTAFAAADDKARLARGGLGPEGTDVAVLPLDLVQFVSWPRPGEDPVEPAWLAALPERPEGDVVVVRKGDGVECVECAIVAVEHDAVTVMLDGERIPVNRERVAGLRWLRPTAKPAGRTRVDVSGGHLNADGVAWSPSGLVLNGHVTLPASWLRAVDYAAGRTIRLVDLEPEKTVVEPFFTGVTAVPEIRGFFAPRVVAGAAGTAPALVLRPRTVVVWRVPSGSRRFRTVVHQEGSRPGRTVVSLALDDREVFRHEPAATADAMAALDVDVTGGRRLTLTVDFAGGAGSPVRLEHPAFEK